MIFSLVGVDFQSVDEAVLLFNTTRRSIDYSVNIFQDALTEGTESFEGKLNGVTVLDGALVPQSLSDQERGRILLSPDTAVISIIGIEPQYLCT